MTAVELVLSDDWLWGWCRQTHTDLPATITPTSDRKGFVVGEPIGSTPETTPVPLFLDADRIACGSQPTPQAALTLVFGKALADLRVVGDPERLTVGCPTHWSPRRRERLTAAGREHSAEVVIQDAALRAWRASRRDRDTRVVVLECGALNTSASALISTYQGRSIETTRFEPELALTELTDPECPAACQFERLLTPLNTQPVSSVLLIGASAEKRGLLTTLIGKIYGETTVRAVGGAELARVPGMPPTAAERSSVVVSQSAADWLPSLRAKASETLHTGPKTRIYLGICVVLAVVVVVFAVLSFTNKSPQSPTAEHLPSAEATTSPPTPTTATPTPQTVGHLRITIPPGWQPTNTGADPTRRLELTPREGPRARIVLTQQQLAPGAGYDQVFSSLQTQTADRPPGTITDLRRNAVYAGRAALGYTEHPRDGSVVDWYVVIAHDIQVSVGCQYPPGGKDSVTPLCTEFGTTLEILE
ncbi:MAG: type VII secretion-associated protein [Mycobacterium sp.]|nr:type VII secretion-associated protein [Mycobacterium sp.]